MKPIPPERTQLTAELRHQFRESQLLGAVGAAGLVLQAIAIGLFSGLTIGVFRLAYSALNATSVFRASQWLLMGWRGLAIITACLAALCLLSGLLLRIEPMIGGSGIPQVELAQAGKYPPMIWYRVLAAKFLATLTSLTAGLSVGREGPCIQMGAAIGVGVGSFFHGRHAQDMHRYLSGGAVAGMTSAFSSPIAGVLFAIEDMRIVLDRRMFLFLAITALTAWASVSGILHLPLVMPFSRLEILTLGQAWIILPAACLMGALGAAYSRALIGCTLWEDRCARLTGWKRLALPFFFSGALLYAYPTVLVGFGPSQVGLEMTSLTLASLAVLFLVKSAFSCLSFASGVSGGILMPILMAGAVAGSACAKALLFFGLISEPQYGTVMAACIAGFFSAVVRTPLCAAALLLEMTGAWSSFPVIVAASLISGWIADATGTRPVYECLRNRILERQARTREA
ncbi:chloride channel protein [Mesosutterella sp. AGMB02718]|uniref:Chloride channel protein n=1 Tax=Mesosutterella faecium TaxID=2925194 RepID=A0ABT7INW0_9BURK|nr:chloride channel protein [Mesosutterella sp. AGMB02718]MDL2059001.1 chloride channel protein [Mesosutterella sp. AGMB02718]